jgi:magnesium-dependent phosphatase 1
MPERTKEDWPGKNSLRLEDHHKEIAEKWGVHRPYILFARHLNLGEFYPHIEFPIPHPERFNEMLIYPQVQESLIVIQRMEPEEVEAAIKNEGAHLHYEQKIGPWNITVPDEAIRDFKAHGEIFV